MANHAKRILLIADIEGSSGCWNYQGSSFMTDDWARACLEMTRDVNTVAEALFESGVEKLKIKDFHRTGYNLLPELIDPRSELVHGYKSGPVPGIGDPGNCDSVIFLGMHAASGTDGFLAHTLTSRISQLEVNGRPLAEIELFSASVANYGLRPLFFSGCPLACEQAGAVIKNISLYPIDKGMGRQHFDVRSWRAGLKKSVIRALDNKSTIPYQPVGPFTVLVKMRDGEAAARKIAKRWNLELQGAQILIKTQDIHELYVQLIRACYLTPMVEKTLPLGLFAYNLRGRIGIAWVRRRLRVLKNSEQFEY